MLCVRSASLTRIGRKVPEPIAIMIILTNRFSACFLRGTEARFRTPRNFEAW